MLPFFLCTSFLSFTPAVILMNDFPSLCSSNSSRKANQSSEVMARSRLIGERVGVDLHVNIRIGILLHPNLGTRFSSHLMLGK